jgi:hypothetical protein
LRLLDGLCRTKGFGDTRKTLAVGDSCLGILRRRMAESRTDRGANDQNGCPNRESETLLAQVLRLADLHYRTEDRRVAARVSYPSDRWLFEHLGALSSKKTLSAGQAPSSRPAEDSPYPLNGTLGDQLADTPIPRFRLVAITHS